MGFIPIPEGKTEIRMADGNWIDIPEGVTEVDTDKIWSDSKSIEPEDTEVRELDLNLTPSTPEYGDNWFGNAIEDTGNMLKGGAANAASLAMAIPANINEAIGVDSSALRETQKNFQGYGQEARDDLVRHPEWAKTVGIAMGNPINLATGGATTVPAIAAAGALDVASEIAGTGDRSGVTFEDTRDVAIGANVGALAKLGLDQVGKLFVGKDTGRLSRAAVDLANEIGLSTKELDELTKGIPKSQQARAMAERLDYKARGILKQAIAENDKTRVAYGNSLLARSKQLSEAIGANKTGKSAIAVDEQFTALKQSIKDSDTTPSSDFNVAGIKDDLESLKNSFGGSPVEGKIQGLINRLDNEPMNTVDSAIDMYRDVNYWYGKTKRGADLKKLDALKSRLKKYISDNGSEKTMKLFSQSNKSYSRLMQQEELIASVKKFTTDEGATDWKGLYQAIRKENISNPETKAAIKLVKSYSKKFGKSDKKLSSQMITKGESATNTLTSKLDQGLGRIFNAEVVQKVLDALPTDAAKRRRIQHDIARAIREANTPQEALDSITRSDFTARNIRQQTKAIEDAVSEPKVATELLEKETPTFPSLGIKGLGRRGSPSSSKPTKTLGESLGIANPIKDVDSTKNTFTLGVKPTGRTKPTKPRQTVAIKAPKPAETKKAFSLGVKPTKPTKATKPSKTVSPVSKKQEGLLGVKQKSDKATKAKQTSNVVKTEGEATVSAKEFMSKMNETFSTATGKTKVNKGAVNDFESSMDAYFSGNNSSATTTMKDTYSKFKKAKKIFDSNSKPTDIEIEELKTATEELAKSFK